MRFQIMSITTPVVPREWITTVRQPSPDRVGIIAAEASQMGFAPGHFPDDLLIRTREGGILHFAKRALAMDPSGEEVVYALYSAPGTPVLFHLLND
jgi:hypothetical protein